MEYGHLLLQKYIKMAASTQKIPFGHLILLSSLNIFFYILASYIGIVIYKETTMQAIICPSSMNNEIFIQSITDGKEVICMYTITHPMNKKIIQKKGTLK